MSLFGPVYTLLSLNKKQENALLDAAGALGLIGEHTHGIQVALEAILAKLNEAGGLGPDETALIEQAAAALGTSAEALRASVLASGGGSGDGPATPSA